MPTTPLAGNRARRARNPRDITGREYARLHAEQAAKEAAANISIGEIRKAARQAGFDAGWEAGFDAGWNALAAYLVEIGVLDPDDGQATSRWTTNGC